MSVLTGELISSIDSCVDFDLIWDMTSVRNIEKPAYLVGF